MPEIFYYVVGIFMLVTLSSVSTTQIISRLDYTATYPNFQQRSLEPDLKREFRSREAENRFIQRQFDEIRDRTLNLNDKDRRSREFIGRTNREQVERNEFYRYRNNNWREETPRNIEIEEIRNARAHSRGEARLNSREKEQTWRELNPSERRETERREELVRVFEQKSSSLPSTKQDRSRFLSEREQRYRMSRTTNNILDVKPSLLGLAFDYYSALQAAMTLTLLIGVLRNQKIKK